MSSVTRILALFCLISIICAENRKIDVTILYETLCADSLKFITEQLYPNWAELSPFINLNLVPFGKSSSVKSHEQFICQHGPLECAGNKIQSCVLNGIQNIDSQVEFVTCFMNSFIKTDLGQSCAAKIGFDWKYVDQCYNSQMGILLQLEAESITKNYLPRFVPTIIYNGVFNQEDQNQSLTNFKAVVCKYLNELYNDVCQ